MYPGNKKYFDACGLTFWHSKGYTGKGVTIATFEDTVRSAHGRKVAGVIAEAAPGATLLSRKRPRIAMHDPEAVAALEAFYRSLIPQVNLITYSVSESGYSPALAALEKRILVDEGGISMFASAGNDAGAIKKSSPSYYGHWFAVGAAQIVTRRGKEVIEKAPYSNIDDKVDFLTLSGLYTPQGTKFTGTSCSSPVAACMVACWEQWFVETHHRHPTPAEREAFIFESCQDMETQGKDARTGRGLFVMPSQLPEVIIPKPEIPEQKEDELVTLPAVDLDVSDRKLTRNFMLHEFQCKCCGALSVSRGFVELVARLQMLRDKVGRPVIVTSGYRCAKHDREVGTSSSPGAGPHTTGTAADIYVSGMSVDALADVARACGFTGIGKYRSQGFVHVDLRKPAGEWEA